MQKGQDISGKSVVVAKERVGQVHADAVRMSYSVVKDLQTGSLEAVTSAVGVLTSQKVNVVASGVGVVRAETVELDRSGIFAVQAKVVRSDEVRAVIVNAGEVHGSVHTVFDREGALAFGVGFGVVMIVWRLIRGLFGR